ncbi:hypothetical protein ES705_14291 [subsurface metagenome]|jgi:hypothetical protein
MNRKITQQEFIILFFSITSVVLLLVPFPKTIIYPTEESPWMNSWDEFVLPWRSHDQQIDLNLTLVYGNLSIFIIDREAFFRWRWDQDFQSYYQIENITDTLILSIQFNPPITQSMYILYIPSEDSSFHRELRITYTFFHSNYGFFFLSIALIVGGRYGYVKIKNR